MMNKFNDNNIDIENNYEEYMKFFEKQSLKEKQTIIIEQLANLAGLTKEMCKSLGLKIEALPITKLKNKEYSEDDFAISVVSYVNSIQNHISNYIEGMDNFLDAVVPPEDI